MLLVTECPKVRTQPETKSNNAEEMKILYSALIVNTGISSLIGRQIFLGALDQRKSKPKRLGRRANYAISSLWLSWPNSTVLPLLRCLLMLLLAHLLNRDFLYSLWLPPELSIHRTKNSRSCKPGQQALGLYCREKTNDIDNGIHQDVYIIRESLNTFFLSLASSWLRHELAKKEAFSSVHIRHGTITSLWVSRYWLMHQRWSWRCLDSHSCSSDFNCQWAWRHIVKMNWIPQNDRTTHDKEEDQPDRQWKLRQSGQYVQSG